jgi:serine/threonine-protein kinase
MMFALLTGEVIHPGETAMDQMVSAASRQARSLLTVWPEAPLALAEVVDTAVAFQKKNRWESAEQMKAALERALFVRPGAAAVDPERSIPFLLVRKP